jgi:hypothetical protein
MPAKTAAEEKATDAPKKLGVTKKTVVKLDLYGDIPKARRHDIGMAMHLIHTARAKLKRSPDKAREELDFAIDVLDAVLSNAPSPFDGD